MGVTDPEKIVMQMADGKIELEPEKVPYGFGTNGDDVFTDYEATQYLFGYGGKDTFRMDADSADYKVAKTIDGTGYVVWNDDGFDLLWDMEWIEFNDEAVELETIGY